MLTSREEIGIILIILMLCFSETNTFFNPVLWQFRRRFKRDKFLRGFVAGFLFSNQAALTSPSPCNPFAVPAG
jgi:hypothetical protein